MTSKEALEHIIFVAKLDKTISSVYYQELIDAKEKIEKDLEILEILKKHYDVSSLMVSLNNFISFHIDKNDKDFNKVKEWLEK